MLPPKTDLNPHLDLRFQRSWPEMAPKMMQRPPEAPEEAVSTVPAFRKRRCCIESINATNYNVFRNSFRKTNENVVLLPEKGCLTAQAPKRAHTRDSGFVVSFNSLGVFLSIGGNVAACEEYSSWMKKKLKANDDSTIKEGGRKLNLMGAVDVPDGCHLLLYELNIFLREEFPQWRVLYDPGVTDVLCFTRRGSTRTSEEDDDSLQMKAADEGARQGTPLQILAHQMRTEENVSLKEKEKNEDVENPPDEWLSAVFVLTPRSIVVHKAPSEPALDQAWERTFPLLKRFLFNPNVFRHNVKTFQDLFAPLCAQEMRN
ncbi:MAG: hypothetical protein KVP17_002361 [Porospora cf. gigantea B]|uniref:uncharacterized protein n=2 Tax=Porospora cf. gigantea B TaxID=2853592 RepID=UPI003571D8E2|nr:MAG: hypothetical protein KVP17_002361 [Porospora cf. gigantea B]